MKNLLNFKRKIRKPSQKYIILQTGNNRSILQDVTTGEFRHYIIDNEYLSILEDIGMIV